MLSSIHFLAVAFGLTFSSSLFAANLRCDLVDSLRPDGWPISIIDIQTNGRAVETVKLFAFAPDENGGFEKFEELIFSAQERIRGGLKVETCIDENAAEAGYGRVFSFCDRLQNPNYDRLTLSLDLSRTNPGQISVEFFERDDQSPIRRIWPFAACR